MVQMIDKSQVDMTGLPEVDLPSGAPVEHQPLRIDIPGKIEGSPQATQELQLNNSGNIQKALDSGYSSEEIQQYLQSQGLDENDAQLAIVSTLSDNIKKAKVAGYSEDEIMNHLASKNYEPNTVVPAIQASNINDKYTQLDYKPTEQNDEDKAMDIADLYKNVHYQYATMAKQVVGLMDEETAISARQDINRLNAAVTNKLKQEGIDAFLDDETGAVMMKDRTGNITEVDSSIMNSLFNSKGEFAGAVTGGIAGARAGAAVGAAVGAAFPPIAPASVGLGTIVGGLSGSAVGAMAGRATDLYVNSQKLSEDLSTSLYLTQIKQAGIADITFGVIGSGIAKVGMKGYRSIVKAYKYVSHGNPKGAYKALKENLNLTDDQVKDMVNQWEKFNKTSAPGDNFADKAISVVTSTSKGAESSVKSAAQISERVATLTKQSIDERAKSLHKAINSIADENAGNAVRSDLKAYQDDVKNFYDTIKKQGAEAIDGTDFRFDLDKLAIDPVMKHIEAKLSNPIARERFVGYASRIASASQDRTFSGLLELRAAVNDFKYSKSLGNSDIDALNQVIGRIDTTIDKAAKKYMPDSKTWGKNFKTAKSEYAKMKVLQESSIFRLVNRPGITEEGIQRALSKYSNDKEVDADIFNSISTRLSGQTKSKVEVAAIKNIVNKNTFGNSTEYQAIDFPQLAEDLKGLNIATNEGSNIIKVVDEIAKVYRNDPELAGLAGRTLAEKSSSLATNLLQKGKQSIIMYTWNSLYKYAPLKSARNIALIHRVEKLLSNPLHARTAEDLMKQFPVSQQPELKSLVKDLQIQQAKQGPVQKPILQKMYKQSASGKLVVTDGALGKGIYLVDKIKNPHSDMNVISHDVDNSKLFDGSNLDLKTFRTDSVMRKSLIDQGYNGVRVNDKAVIFPETMQGYKTPKMKIDTGDIHYRGAPVEETASTVKPRSTPYIYTTTDKETATGIAGNTGKVNTFKVPKNAKVLTLGNKTVANKVFKDLFNSKFPKGYDNLDKLMFDLHEGKLGRTGGVKEEQFIQYLKDNNYSGHSYGVENAWLPGILKDNAGSISEESAKDIAKRTTTGTTKQYFKSNRD